MADYDLYYWPVPFRGQFVRAVLAFAGKGWVEADAAAISDLVGGAVERMPVPFMGPPVLVDRKAKFAIAQMPAIILYLGETLGLMPATPALRAMTAKVVNDANDVIDDLTCLDAKPLWHLRRCGVLGGARAGRAVCKRGWPRPGRRRCVGAGPFSARALSARAGDGRCRQR